MKEQYIGDVKDYGKYRFLQTLCGSTGLKLGINWYLTPNDSTNQGNLGGIDRCEDDLYQKVQRLKAEKASLSDVEISDILPDGTVTYRNTLEYMPDTDNRSFRAAWHEEALDALACCDVIFLDPDTGVVANDFLDSEGDLRDSFFRLNKKRDGTRYVSLDEVRDFLNHGQSLILFQYGQRTGIEPQLRSVYYRLTQFIGKPDITYIFRYSKTTADAIAFICYNQTKHAHLYKRFKAELLDRKKPWSAYFSIWEEPLMFSKELVNKGKIVEAATLAGAPVGNFVVTTLRSHFGPDWWSEVEGYFRNQSYPPRPAGRDDTQRADSLDISKSLQLIDGLWKSVFSQYMQKKPDVYTAVRLYNIAKHENNQSGFSDIDTYNALMAMISVLEMTGNSAEATLLRQNYLDVGEKINDIVKPQLEEIRKGQGQPVVSAQQNQPISTDSPQPARKPSSSQEKLRILIMQVPKGKVTTYGWLAQQVYGNTSTTPAVLSMIKAMTGTSVPCHRVVSSDGQPKAPDANYGSTGKTHKQLLLSEGVLFIDSQTIDLGKCMFKPRFV